MSWTITTERGWVLRWTSPYPQLESYVRWNRLWNGVVSRRPCVVRACPTKCFGFNGPEYLNQTLVDWANQHRITLLYIQPGKPTQNAYIERFNRTVRHEWLDMHQFESIAHAQLLATQWLWQYNNGRPNTAIGGVPPRQLIQAA